jgi:hypothetical protein
MTYEQLIAHLAQGDIVPRIVCKDGFSMSVQASESHYCTPRADADFYTHVEVGFPSDDEESLRPFSEWLNDDEESGVYPFVPIQVVLYVINKHGGV